MLLSIYQHCPDALSIKQRRKSVDLSPKSFFWTSKQLFAIRFLLATCNVCPLAIPEFFAHNMGISVKRAIFPSLKWGEGWSRCSSYFVQDCRLVSARGIFRACSLQNEVSDLQFFYISDITNSSS